MVLDHRYHIVFMRKENHRTCLEEEEGSVIFHGSNHENSSPSLVFPRGPQEELFQILWARPLIAGCCIDWAAVEQVQKADAIRALLTTDPWELFFGIIKPIYLEFTMELCSTFHFQTGGDRALASSTLTTPTSYGVCCTEEAYEDIPDDVPPRHKDPPSQPPPPSRPVHAAASYTDISERLTRFE
ncbi:hypothetical protein GOBAR_AA00375 [Gossypium barbadense]|uniref:Uncharacterized protein n=1 Tax=Gossypium barbadense TaxID=3634 RepID=A0A2P5YXA5_GOSBA|nr:hypothetical protein GOBAR_AA00375 [Gossypium barbadense]